MIWYVLLTLWGTVASLLVLRLSYKLGHTLEKLESVETSANAWRESSKAALDELEEAARAREDQGRAHSVEIDRYKTELTTLRNEIAIANTREHPHLPFEEVEPEPLEPIDVIGTIEEVAFGELRAMLEENPRNTSALNNLLRLLSREMLEGDLSHYLKQKTATCDIYHKPQTLEGKPIERLMRWGKASTHFQGAHELAVHVRGGCLRRLEVANVFKAGSEDIRWRQEQNPAKLTLEHLTVSGQQDARIMLEACAAGIFIIEGHIELEDTHGCHVMFMDRCLRLLREHEDENPLAGWKSLNVRVKDPMGLGFLGRLASSGYLEGLEHLEVRAQGLKYRDMAFQVSSLSKLSSLNTLVFDVECRSDDVRDLLALAKNKALEKLYLRKGYFGSAAAVIQKSAPLGPLIRWL